MYQTPNLTKPDSPDIGRQLAARYALGKLEKRQADRERIHRQIVHPIDTPQLIRDPLKRRESRFISTITTARLLLLAAVVHLLIILFFIIVNQFIGKHTEYQTSERVKVHIRDVPPPEEPPQVEELAAIEGPVEPEFSPPKKEQKIEKKKPKRIEPATQKEPEAPETTPEPVRHRIVGLSLESTVQGGGGPSFAIGTSRMGKTDRRATDPNQASRTPAKVGPEQSGSGSAREQRIATRIPTRDSVFVKPKRSKPSKPVYPATLRAQGIEGNALVRVDIDVNGNVSRVTVLGSSGHPAFDEAARKAALTEQFSPATRDGKPVAFTLSYTYRFRIEDN